MSNTHTQAGTTCIPLLYMNACFFFQFQFQSLLCVVVFAFFFFILLQLQVVFFSKKSYERCKCIRRYAFPYSHPLRFARCVASFSFSYSISISILCSSSTYRRVYLLGAPSSLTATSATASLSLTLSVSLALTACMQLAVNLNAPWRLSLLPFYVIRFFLFSHRSTAQQQQQPPQHLMHSQCQ